MSNPTGPPGWYDDPGRPGYQRYWTGDKWHPKLQRGGKSLIRTRLADGVPFLIMLAVIAVLATGAVLGWKALQSPSTACQQAKSDGHPSHACYLENVKDERELRESEVHLHRVEGVGKGDEEAEARKEFREGWEEAEKEAHFYGE